MSWTQISALLIENRSVNAALSQEVLAQALDSTCTLKRVDSLSDGLMCLEQGGIDLVLLCISDPAELDALSSLRAGTPEGIPVVVICHDEDEELALRAIRAGAQDCLCTQDVNRSSLMRSIQKAIERHNRLLQASARTDCEILRRNEELAAEIQSLKEENAELRSAEETLRQSESRLRAIFDHTFQLIGLLAPDGTLMEVNRAAVESLGSSPSNVFGKRFWETPWWAHSKEEQEKVRTAVAAAACGKFVRFETSNVSIDGSIRDIDFSLKPLMDNAGKVVLLIPEGRDITERKRTEQALWQSSQMLRLAMHHLPGFVFWKDRNSVYLGCNSIFAANAGLNSPEEIVGLTDFDLPWKCTEAESYRNDDRLVMESGVPKLNYEETQLIVDGSVAELRTSKVPLRDTEGRVIGVLGAFEDITERKRAEKMLAEAEAKYRCLVEESLFGVYLIQRERFVFVNACMAAVFGYQKEDLIGRPIEELVAPEDRAHVAARVKKRETGQVQSMQYTFRGLRKDGHVIDVEVRGTRTFYNGSPAVLGSVLDITERKQSEEALRRLNRELRAISDCNEILLRATDEQTLVNDICRIVCDEAGYRMAWVGYAENDTAKSVRPVAWAGFEDGYLATVDITWADTERGRGPTGAAIRSGRSMVAQDFEVDPRMAPWQERALQLGYRSSIALPLKGEHADTFGTLTIYSAQPNSFAPEEIRLLEELAGDLAFGIVTLRTREERTRGEEEQSRLRQHLQQAQKMEAVGQLAGGIAHDFNNILGIINGYSEMLLRDPRLQQAARGSIEEILAAGERAASLTRQLLAFSRKLVLKPKVLNLNVVIEGIDKMLRRLIGEEIEVTTLLDPNLESVNADPGQMEQVFLNFYINARDAMPQGGRITIETANVEVDESLAAQHFSMAPGRYVRVAVTDTGIGMDKETLSHVFEPFFTTKGPEHGTGLGLATVYGIVKQSDGQVWANSTPGKGTTLFVYLPVSSEAVEVLDTSRWQREFSRGTETVLLVEDAAPLRALFRKIVEDRGYTVLEAEDGERAIQIADRFEGDISLLLTDVSLPKMKGPALADILLQHRSGVKVLFVSGHSDTTIAPEGVLQAGTAFLQKPFTAEALIGKMRELLDEPAQGATGRIVA